MLRDLNISVGGRRDSTDPFVGSLASGISSGFPLEAWLLNDVDAGFPNRLYSLEVLTLPSAGELYLNKVGAGTFKNAPDGTYSGTMRVEKFDLGVGRVYSEVGNYSLTVGSGGVVNPPATPTVTGVTITPTTATGSRTFTASVLGANSPSQAVTWTTTGGTVANGVFTEPAKTNVVQTIKVRATSQADTNYWAEATVTIAATAVVTPPASSSYPTVDKVLAGVKYGPTGVEYTGTYVPPTSSETFTLQEIAEAVWEHQVALSIPQFLGLK